MKNEPYLTLALHIQLLSLPIPALLAEAQPSWLHPPCPPSQPVVWQEERVLDPALLKTTLTVQTQVGPVSKSSLVGLSLWLVPLESLHGWLERKKGLS